MKDKANVVTVIYKFLETYTSFSDGEKRELTNLLVDELTEAELLK